MKIDVKKEGNRIINEHIEGHSRLNDAFYNYYVSNVDKNVLKSDLQFNYIWSYIGNDKYFVEYLIRDKKQKSLEVDIEVFAEFVGMHRIMKDNRYGSTDLLMKIGEKEFDGIRIERPDENKAVLVYEKDGILFKRFFERFDGHMLTMGFSLESENEDVKKDFKWDFVEVSTPSYHKVMNMIYEVIGWLNE